MSTTVTAAPCYHPPFQEEMAPAPSRAPNRRREAYRSVSMTLKPPLGRAFKEVHVEDRATSAGTQHRGTPGYLVLRYQVHSVGAKLPGHRINDGCFESNLCRKPGSKDRPDDFADGPVHFHSLRSGRSRSGLTSPLPACRASSKQRVPSGSLNSSRCLRLSRIAAY